jgi:hypothetical protein
MNIPPPCRFCGRDLGRHWTAFDATPFTLSAAGGQPAATLDGDWPACPKCATAVRARDWAGLARRVEHLRPSARGSTGGLLDLFNALGRNLITGGERQCRGRR